MIFDGLFNIIKSIKRVTKKVLCFYFLFFLIFSFQIEAQQLSLVSSGGGIISTGSFKGAYSIGETVINSHILPNHKLTQGFHQTFIFPTQTEDLTISHRLMAYPNPVANQLFIQTETSIQIGSLKAYSLNGQLIDYIRASDLKFVADILSVDCNHWTPGITVLQVFDLHNRPIHSFTIIKI